MSARHTAKHGILASCAAVLAVASAPALAAPDAAETDVMSGAALKAADTPAPSKTETDIVLVGMPVSKNSPAITYPTTEIVPQVDEQFGVKVADPYRWLEDDVRVNPKVASWVAEQNKATDAYLATLPARGTFATRMKQLFNYERFGLPRKAGKRYFYTRNDGLQNQSVLYVRDGLNGAGRVLINPNGWAKDGATALDGWVPSKSGKLIAYAEQDGGSDWRTIKVLNVATGESASGDIQWAKFTNIAWVGDEGFLYSRFAEPKKGEEFQQLNFNQQLYFHKIGTAQSADQLVYATPDRPKLGHSASVTGDGRWAVITSAQGTDDKYEINLIPLFEKTRSWKTLPLITGLDHDWSLIDGIGDKIWFATNKDAPKLKVVQVDLNQFETQSTQCNAGSVPSKKVKGYCLNREPAFSDVVAERAETLASANIVGDRLILSYLKDAQSMALMTDLAGKPVRQISLNAIGTASGFGGKAGDPETFYSFSSFNRPSTIYRLDAKTGKTSIFAAPKLAFNPDDFVVEQKFFASKDGTKVPMFVIRKSTTGPGAPTLLYGYGGFNISSTPGFSPTRLAWVDKGGVLAIANLRGGGEYGKAWHDAGRLLNKQNVFDDFISAGEYLIAQGITGKGKLAIEGRSNGGLLVGAVVNQRPDLFAAALPGVGVMDMLRFDRFTAGRYWVDDYGYPNKEADFKNLFAYSPYHNVRSGVSYPAIMVTTADTDDRVVPGHSFKYTAAIQAAKLGDRPRLIRIETRAGHGSGKPTDKVIAEFADMYAFIAKWTELEVE